MFTTKISISKKLPNIKIISPSKNKDSRGEIYTILDKRISEKILPKNLKFNHIKTTRRNKNCLVGIHSDNKTWKLFGCIKGKIFHNVSCLDNRNKKYLKSQNFILSEKQSKFILIPPKYGNSFYCYEESVIIYCLAYTGKYNDISNQYTHAWNDKVLNIKWPCKKPHLSSRDSRGLKLDDSKSKAL